MNVNHEAATAQFHNGMLERTVLESLAAQIGDQNRYIPPDARNKLPYTDDERLVLTGLLKYVDHCLPFNNRSIAPIRQIRRNRAVAKNILDISKPAYDEDDIIQESRLSVITTVRSFNRNLNVSVLTLVGIGIGSSLRNQGRREITHGMTSGRGALIPSKAVTTDIPFNYSRLRSMLFEGMDANFREELFDMLHKHPHYYEHIPFGRIADKQDNEAEAAR